MIGFFRGNVLSIDAGLLILRIASGLMMITHGWPKLIGFADRMNSFPDPFKIGHPASLALTVFAEFFCSILLIIGYYTRFATIPLIIAMATIVLMIHWPDPFSKKELPLMFLASYLTIFFAGPGKYSIDG
jgi:putative oxidoreductase